MSKRVCGSNVRDPKNRSKKDCVCGGHSAKDKQLDGRPGGGPPRKGPGR